MTNVLTPRFRKALPLLLFSCGAISFSARSQQASTAPPATTAPIQASAPQTSSSIQIPSDQKAGTTARRPKRRRVYATRQTPAPQVQTTQTQSTQVAPTAEQRARDQKILEQQKSQSARIARENDATTKAVIKDRQRVQAEQRIQDAPTLTDQPLSGAAVVPPAPATEQPRIQDAPGPAQIPPTPAPATQPAPQ